MKFHGEMHEGRYVLKTSYQVPQVLETRDKLYFALVEKFAGTTVRGQEFIQFVELVSKILKLSDVHFNVLKESLQDIVGIPLTSDQLVSVCWRLAGNLPSLQSLRTAAVWRRQVYLEWVPAQVDRVRPMVGGRRGRQLGHELRFRILAGSPASLSVNQWWSYKKSRYLASYRDEQRRGFMFSKPWRVRESSTAHHPFMDARQFMTLRCLILIDPELCLDDELGFFKIRFDASSAGWNKEQQKYRTRLEPGYGCPFDMPLLTFCHRCPVGLSACRAATHEATYEYRICAVCGVNAAHDPLDQVSKCCVQCSEQRIIESLRS